MTPEELHEEYIKLSEKDQVIFKNKIKAFDKNGKEERLKGNKKEVLKKLMEVKGADGTPYFSEIYLKDKLGI